MSTFNQFYISSSRVFWAINFAFAILVVLLIGFVFNFEAREILIQLLIAIVMTIALIRFLGGFKKIKAGYLKRQMKKKVQSKLPG